MKYGQYFPHRTGHGLGIEVNPCHEPPDLVAGSGAPLAIGTTFTIEPGVYIDGVGGVRIGNDYIRCRAASNKITPHATAALSDSTRFASGMHTAPVLMRRASELMPLASPPMISAFGSRQGTSS